MNKKTVLISLVLALIFAFTIVNADTTGIKDIDDSSSYARGAILALAEKDIVKGDNLGNFEPTKAISRAEFITLLDRVLGLDTTDVPATATFKDVPTTHWAFKYVEAAYKAGIINGISPTEFGINQISTREQMAVIFVRALKLMDPSEQIDMMKIGALTDKDKISTWAQRDVDVAMTAGLMNGMTSTTFAPKANATKEQTAVVIDRFMGKEDVIAENVKTTYGLNKKIQYSDLYNALKADSQADYKGDLEMNLNMLITDLDTKDYMNTTSKLTGTINDNAMKAHTYMKLETNTDNPVEIDTQMITTADKVYELDTDGKWIEYDRSEWESANGGNPFSMGEVGGTGMMAGEFINSFNRLPIQAAGTETVGNVTAEKYLISLDSDHIKSLLSDEQYDELTGALGEAYQGTERYDLTFYVADGHIVKESVNFSGVASDKESGMNLEVKMAIDASYSNIGTGSQITLPDAADIKQPVDLEQ